MLDTATSLILHGAAAIIAAGAAAGFAAWTTERLALFSYAFVVALGHVVLFGLPLFVILRRRGYRAWWLAPICGFLGGAFPPFLLSFLTPDSASVNGAVTVADGFRTWAGWVETFKEAGFFGAAGACGGAAFWLALKAPPWLAVQKDHGPVFRLVVLAVAASAAVIVTAAAVLPDTLKDRSCHNVLRDGRVTADPELVGSLNVAEADWPELALLTERFSGDRRWSYRGGLWPNRPWKPMYMSVCIEAGTLVSISYLDASLRGMDRAPLGTIVVYAPQGGDAWKAPFADLYWSIEARWPGAIRFERSGSPMPSPPWLAERDAAPPDTN